jgi:prepilin-type N-terminal cleavage/methylation domain-containing protein
MSRKFSHPITSWCCLKTEGLQRKVKAFTLIEVTVVLIISGTVMTLAMWSYSNVMKYLRTYNEQEAANQELVLFLSHFTADLEKAAVVTEKRGSLQLEFPESVVSYDFYSDLILRTEYQYPDTFFLKTLLFDYEPLPLQKDWVEQVYLTLELSGTEYPMAFYKNYSHQQLFQAYEY